jgi:hypothetical protein
MRNKLLIAALCLAVLSLIVYHGVGRVLMLDTTEGRATLLNAQR